MFLYIKLLWRFLPYSGRIFSNSRKSSFFSQSGFGVFWIDLKKLLKNLSSLSSVTAQWQYSLNSAQWLSSNTARWLSSNTAVAIFCYSPMAIFSYSPVAIFKYSPMAIFKYSRGYLLLQPNGYLQLQPSG